MSRLFIPLLMLSALLLGLAACSDDPATPSGDDPSVVEGTLVPAGPDFEIELEFAASLDSLMRGPFLLRGQNLHYSDLLGALIVDFTITNIGEVTHAEPVTIHFFRLIPETTRILNSPDDSPFFTFEFANDDAMWTPGEESFPLQVMFSAEIGQSVGFNAGIGVGGPVGAFISGLVWLDSNRNGLFDPDERPLPRIPIVADNGGPERGLSQVYSGADGRFRFRSLEPGTWEIRVLTIPDGLGSTTPSNLHVLLAPPMGVRGGFDKADFGFAEFTRPD